MHRWRPLLPSDIATVSAIARIVHPEFPEDDAVFADRQAIAPDACLLLEIDGTPTGYILAHPWRLGTLPALNTVLGAIPDHPDTLYIHDLALLPLARGTGAARHCVEIVSRVAEQFGAMSLVAVNNSVPFWTAMGFAAQPQPQLSSKLATYSADACYMIRTTVSPTQE